MTTDRAETTALEYDPYSYELDRDPYPVYLRLQDEEPAYFNERLGFWALTRFDDVHRALVDWNTYSSAEGTVLELMGSELSGTIIIFMDPPRQTRYRNLVSKVFTPGRIGGLEGPIRELAVEHLDRLEGKDSFDAVGEFTAKLPMDVISTMLGIPEQDRDMVRGWSNDVLHRDPGRPEPPKRAIEAQGSLADYFGKLIDEKTRRPAEDLMSALIDCEIKGEGGETEKLSRYEMTTFANLLATAGNETVTKLLATAIYWLWRYPDQRRALVDDPSLIAGAVEETLRFDPPSHYQGRTLTRDVELHGHVMPEGARVMLINGATGRDKRRFPDPDRYDVRRQVDMHLAFGYGTHSCLGAALARLESRIALGEFLLRFPDYSVVESGVEWMHSSNVRGLSGLVVSA